MSPTMQHAQLSLRETLVWLWSFWRNLRIRLLLLTILTPITVVFKVYTPIFLAQIFDELVKTEISTDIIQEKTLYILGFGVTHFLLYIFVQSMRGITNVGLESSFRIRIFQYIVTLGQSFYQKFTTGDLITRLIDDVSERKLGWFACSGIFRFYEALLIIIGCLFLMFGLNVYLTIATIVPLLITVYFYIKFSSLMTSYAAKTQQAISELNSFLTTTFDGIRIVMSYNQQHHQTRAFAKVVDNQLTKEIALTKITALLQLSYARSAEIIITLIFLLGGWLVIYDYISLGTLIAFNAYILMLVWPMVDIGQFFVKGRGAGVCVHRISELENFRQDIGNARGALPFPSSQVRLEFKNATYIFPNGDCAFEDVCFRIEPRETVAIAGAVGSGKSVFLNLLPRIIEPVRGQVLLNDIELPRYDLQELRTNIGFATQISYLFSDTIKNNITFGRCEITDEQIAVAVRVAQLEQDLKLLSDDLETLIGQRGVKISGGQKQRIAIARAIVNKPAILILDDCTSALDAETEARLWKHLYQFIPDMMVVLVTHRISSLQKTDKIILLEKGKVVDVGTHSSLQHSAYYRSLYMG